MSQERRREEKVEKKNIIKKEQFIKNMDKTETMKYDRILNLRIHSGVAKHYLISVV